MHLNHILYRLSHYRFHVLYSKMTHSWLPPVARGGSQEWELGCLRFTTGFLNRLSGSNSQFEEEPYLLQHPMKRGNYFNALVRNPFSFRQESQVFGDASRLGDHSPVISL